MLYPYFFIDTKFEFLIDKRFKELEMREKVVKYMYNPEVQRIKGLQRHSYYNELSRHDAGAKDFNSRWIEMKLGN